MKLLTKFDNCFKQKNFHRGFTLMEIMIVVVTLGVIASLAFSNYKKVMEQSYCRTAQMNLLAIYNAEIIRSIKDNSTIFLMNNASINNKYKLHINDDNFNYQVISEPTTTAMSITAHRFPGPGPFIYTCSIGRAATIPMYMSCSDLDSCSLIAPSLLP